MRSVSLNYQWLCFAAIISFLCYVVITSFYFIHSTKENFHVATTKIERIFFGTYKLHTQLGERIANEHAYKDYRKILDIFSKPLLTDEEVEKASSWSNFDWVNADGFQVINSRIGIRKQPINMNPIREYTKSTKITPWTLQFSSPAMGNPSKMWVIPVATGITSPQYHYLGCIVSGISINRLKHLITETVQIKNLHFMLTDLRNSQPLIASSPNVATSIKEKKSLLSEEYFIHNTPYKINIGMENSLLLVLLGKSLFPQWLNFFTIMILIFGLVIVVKQNQNSQAEIEVLSAYVKEIQQSLTQNHSYFQEFQKFVCKHINRIVTISHELRLRFVEEESEIGNKVFAQAQSIYSAAFDVKDGFDKEIRIERTDIQSLLQEAVTFHRPLAQKNGIHIIIKNTLTLPCYTDSNKVKLLFIQLLAHLLQSLPKETSIELITATQSDGFMITFKDNGFGFQEDLLLHSLAVIPSQLDQLFDLANLLRGHFRVNHHIGYGSQIEVFLPRNYLQLAKAN